MSAVSALLADTSTTPAAGGQHAAHEAADAARACHANRSARIHIQLSPLPALR
jgi:hypothetical protein